MTGFRTIAEVAMGVVYLVGASFNSFWTLGHTDEFYESFVEGAWLRPARTLLSDVVVPNARLITILVIVFQVIVGILIISRGDLVKLALIVGGTFALAVAVVSSPGGTIGNLLLAGIQFALAFTR
jgi:hypothetical protein